MIARDIIQKILDAGVRAPSKNNSEPWQFEVAGETISVFMIPEKDDPVSNVNQWRTIFAIGALVENVSIAAAYYGFEAAIDFFPVAENRDLVAKIGLAEKQGAASGDLFDAIFKRTTNRGSYRTEPIDGGVRERLLGAPAEVGAYEIVLKLVEDRGQIETLARAASANEKIATGGAGGVGFLSRIKNAFRGGAPGGVGRVEENAQIFAACSFYGGVLCEPTDIGVARAGQVVEHAWLVATDLGLSFQMQTSINFLRVRLDASDENVSKKLFSEKEEYLIRAAYDTIVNIFQTQDHFCPAIFRIGYGGEPSARSPRKPPEIMWR